jgi:hypothetical protein
MENLENLENLQNINAVDITSLTNSIFSLATIFGLSEQAASISNIVAAIFVVLTSLGYIQKIKEKFSTPISVPSVPSK